MADIHFQDRIVVLVKTLFIFIKLAQNWQLQSVTYVQKYVGVF
jgi:hypothetical protein